MAAATDFRTNDKAVAWYEPAVTSVPGDVRDLLENYSRIAPEQVVQHVVAFRDIIWDISAWPCVGTFRFLDLSLQRQPSYSRILTALQGSAKLLDVGCCMAQDLRKLVRDGARSENLVGIEITPGLSDISYDLFRDRDSYRGSFINGDIFDYAQPTLEALKGGFSFIHLGMVLHTWDLQGQVTACVRLVELLRPQVGVLILGQAVGHLVAQETGSTKKIFRHNCQSFERLWDEVGRRTGTRWTVRAELDDGLGIGEKKRSWDDPNAKRLRFEVERL